MTWTSLSFAYGSVLTSTKMTQLYDNLTALAKGHSGAPSIINAAVDAAAAIESSKLADHPWGYDDINNAGGSSSGSTPGSGGVDVTLNTYNFGWGLGEDQQLSIVARTDTSPTYGEMRIKNTDSSSHTYDWRWRYLTASDNPFIFIIYNPSTDEILHLWEAEDPPPKFHHDHVMPVGLDPTNIENWPVIPDDTFGLEGKYFFGTTKLLLDNIRETKDKDGSAIKLINQDWRFNAAGNILIPRN